MVASKLKAKCSQCGRTFRADTRGELLSLVRKHMWKAHDEWMRRRIKTGLRKSKKQRNNVLGFVVPKNHAPGNPFAETLKKILNPSWTGFLERPVIEKITGRPYEQVRSEALDAFVAQLFTGVL